MKERKEKSSKTVNKGFTLIELLVVVVIIGILAAIALPQYRNVVGKAELAQVISATKAIQNAQERFYLLHGEYTTDFQNLDVDLPSDNVICLMNTGIYSTCYNNNYAITHYYSQNNSDDNRTECFAKNQKFLFACEEFLGKKGGATTSGPCNRLGVSSCYQVVKKLAM